MAAGKFSLWNRNGDTLISRYASSIRGRTVVRGGGRVGTGGHRGPRVGRNWSRGSGSGGCYPSKGAWGFHAGEGRGTGFGVMMGNLFGVVLIFGRGSGVGRLCPET